MTNSESTKTPSYSLVHVENPGTGITQVLFNGTNYDDWSQNLLLALLAKGKLGYIDGTVPKPSASAPEFETWRSTNALVTSWIYNSIELAIRRTISRRPEAKQVWSDIKKRFCQSNDARIYRLQTELVACRQGPTESLMAYYGRLTMLWDDLLEHDPLPSCSCKNCTCDLVTLLDARREKKQIRELLMGLDERFDTVRSQIIGILILLLEKKGAMTKRVHPNVSFKSRVASNLSGAAPKPCVTSINDNTVDYTSTSGKDGVVALTVWRKSLLLNCKGFTVFDCNGNIVFRVDNYVAGNKGEILLMDAHGKPLLTIRRKKLSWGDNWQIYEGESSVNPKYLVQKQGNLLINNPKNMNLAQVQPISKVKKNNNCKETTLLYHIEGSYAQKNVVMYNNKRQRVAEIKKKEAPNGVTLGGDVFKLVIVRPTDIDCPLAMALVILLDQMFGSS